MTYFAFLDFGLTDDDFLPCLYNTSNSLQRSADINKEHWDRVTRSHLFLNVSKEEFEKISKLDRHRFDVCFIKNSSGQVMYSEKYSSIHQQWMDQGGGTAMPHEIFIVNPETVKRLSPAYIEHDTSQLIFQCAFLFEE